MWPQERALLDQLAPGNGDSREVQGAAPLKGLSTFCNSLESAIFPKLRKRMPSFFLFPPEGQMTSNFGGPSYSALK